MRKLFGILYLFWALALTGFATYLIARSLDFEGQIRPTGETIALLAAMLIAPLLPFARKILIPGGGGVDMDLSKTRYSGRTAEEGIAKAIDESQLPDVDLWEDQGQSG